MKFKIILKLSKDGIFLVVTSNLIRETGIDFLSFRIKFNINKTVSLLCYLLQVNNIRDLYSLKINSNRDSYPIKYKVGTLKNYAAFITDLKMKKCTIKFVVLDKHKKMEF